MPQMAEREPFRIVIVGTCGAGKSTLGRRVARRFEIDHIELDELYWGPNWTPVPEVDFRTRLSARLAAESWVVTGNYSKYRPDIFARASHVVWLNYSAWTVGHQLLSRSVRRAATREKLFGGCVETFRQTFASRDSILLYAIQTFRSNRREYRKLFDSDQYRTVERVELQSRHQAETWISSLG